MDKEADLAKEDAWKKPDIPPNATKVRARTCFTSGENGLSAKAWLPFVISMHPIIIHCNVVGRYGICRSISAKMEKSITYPPIRVRISKPFKMPASMISNVI